MKKLLLVAALLAMGTNLLAITEGISINLPGDTLYNPAFSIKDNALRPGFGDITTGDNAVHNNRAVNIFRDKGEGWKDKAATHILLNVLEPIIIESEVDFMYTQAVEGDGLNIGDIGFRVKGVGPATVRFRFVGDLFNPIGGRSGKVTAKGHNGFFPQQTRNIGPGTETITDGVWLTSGQAKELEVDVYLDDVGTTGLHFGVIVAEARYE